MSANPEPDSRDEELEQTVIRYLQSHRDFFDHHPELLSEMEISHSSGGAVSLIERQVATLREKSNHYKQQLEELIAVARENEQLNDQLHELTLTLIDSIEFDEVLNALQDKLHDDFQAEAVELHLFTAAQADRETNPDLDGFRELIDGGKPVCGQPPRKLLEYLFGPQAEDIGSAALIPLQDEGLLGLLAIGSHSKHRFHPGMGTDYLCRLGEIVGKTLVVVSEPGF